MRRRVDKGRSSGRRLRLADEWNHAQDEDGWDDPAYHDAASSEQSLSELSESRSPRSRVSLSSVVLG